MGSPLSRQQAIAKLVDRAVASGDIRLELDPLDLLRALAGVANIGLGPDGERAAKRLVDILIAGVRTRSYPSAPFGLDLNSLALLVMLRPSEASRHDRGEFLLR